MCAAAEVVIQADAVQRRPQRQAEQALALLPVPAAACREEGKEEKARKKNESLHQFPSGLLHCPSPGGQRAANHPRPARPGAPSAADGGALCWRRVP